MNTWYELTPIDTLFFRGNEPMEAGQPTAVPLFPPPVSVVQGALRTAVLREKGISFADYKHGRGGTEIVDLIGECGKEAPFVVTALLIRRNGILYAPAPANWFIDLPKSEKPQSSSDYIARKIVTAASTAADAANLGITSSSGPAPLVVAQYEAVPLTGCWVNVNLFTRQGITLSENDLLTDGDLYAVEPRIGIGLNERRTVVEGKLYSANHLRLRDGVTLVAVLDKNPGLTGKGFLQLGGEQRKCHYEQIDSMPLPGSADTPKGYVALAPAPANEPLLPKVIAAHRPVVIAGWDLGRGFHKPTAAWLPAGSVFSEKINDSCIPLAL